MANAVSALRVGPALIAAWQSAGLSVSMEPVSILTSVSVTKDGKVISVTWAAVRSACTVYAQHLRIASASTATKGSFVTFQSAIHRA